MMDAKKAHQSKIGLASNSARALSEEVESTSNESKNVVRDIHANLEMLDDLYGRMNFMMREINQIIKRS